jgi:hypothetical protein
MKDLEIYICIIKDFILKLNIICFQTSLYNELLIYSLKKKSWTMIQSPGAPPPRSSHQVLTIVVIIVA